MLALLDRYRHKIKSAEELRDIVGSRPRENRVIMCHGVFDIVHPGHVRHLLYAKGKADILIACLTADAHISKGPGRPHVPQDLRAMNLAAFELVDFVLVDTNAEPLEIIRLIQPDFFAKGFEYNGGNTKTSVEAEALSSYGGELIFTPGDVVYSSSRLLKASKPSLKLEKLEWLMLQRGLGFDELHDIIDTMKNHSVHVVGDTIVDSITYCTPTGAHGKTPTLSVVLDSKRDFVGGAAVVAKHLAAAGAGVSFSTVIGADKLGEFVLDDLAEHAIQLPDVVVSNRPTTNKNVILASDYRLLKVDTLDNSSIGQEELDRLAEAIRKPGSDAVVFSDFRHGIFNKRNTPTLRYAVPEGVYTVADSQVASRWGNITDFLDCDLITPNEREARFALGDQDSGVRPLASDLCSKANCKLLILKLGERGILTCCGQEHDNFFALDSFAEDVIDPVGSGDALLAYATLSMLASKNPVVASILGNIAAGLECECEGNIPVTSEDMHSKLDAIQGQMA